MTDREKFLNTARSYIGKDGYYVCKTKLGYDAVYDWCAFAVSAIMKDCGFIGKYTSGVHSFASDEGRYGDGKYGTWFLKYSQAVQPGDIIMFRYSSLNPIDKYSASHVGIVEAVNGNTLTTLEGNVEAYEVKRNPQKYSPARLEEKVAEMKRRVFCGQEVKKGGLSMEDM